MRMLLSARAFVGNVILKLYEGVGATMMSMIKKGMMSDFQKQDGCAYGRTGAGKKHSKLLMPASTAAHRFSVLKGLVVKSHGSAKSVEIRHAIFQCEQFKKEEKINEKIEEFLAAEQKAQEAAKNEKRNKITEYIEITDRKGGEPSWNWKC